jgi:hypothetical protein
MFRQQEEVMKYIVAGFAVVVLSASVAEARISCQEHYRRCIWGERDNGPDTILGSCQKRLEDAKRTGKWVNYLAKRRTCDL